MAKPRVQSGGGIAALLYSARLAKKSGGFWKLFSRLRSRNACKTCAVGMGGAKGGMVNEAGHFPEVCKKSLQAQAADMQAPITEDFFKTTSLVQLQSYTPAQFENLGRLTFPILAEKDSTHWRRISWDEALQRSAEAFSSATPNRTFFYCSGRSSNEAAFLLQLVVRVYGTNNVHNCSYYCHNASGVALQQVYGSSTSSVELDDLQRTDLAVVVGANPASNHPRLMTQLVQLRRRGGKVLVINPLKELGLSKFRVPSDWRSMLFGSTIADVYLQPHIGGDIATFVGLLKYLVENAGIDLSFVQEHTEGWEALRHQVESTSWAQLEESSGIPIEQLQRAGELLKNAPNGILMWAMGLTHHTFGVDNIVALANLALARGWLGKPGAGLLPIRGHSNVQGIGSVGVSPQLKANFAERLEKLYGVTLPSTAGQDTYSSMVAAHQGAIDAAFILGGNLYGSSPDSPWAAEALQTIPLTLYATTKLNPGHVLGRGKTAIVLPVLARDEEPQPTTQESMFNFVRLSAGGKPVHEGEMWSEVRIIAEFAKRLLPQGRFDWEQLTSHAHLRQAISQTTAGYEPLATIENQGGEFTVRGRIFHTPTFATPTQKARFGLASLPVIETSEFRLMTLRSEGQFNSVVYDEEDLYRGNTRRDVVMMSADDATRLHVREGDLVTVRTSVGSMDVYVAIVDIRSGNLAMYYPEANQLVPRRLDPLSKTPAFKSIVAQLVVKQSALRVVN